MKKVNNNLCNVNSYSYDEDKQELTVKYKLINEKIYQNFSKESFMKLEKRNSDNKTIGLCLRKELKNN